jgi:hypothetical protein
VRSDSGVTTIISPKFTSIVFQSDTIARASEEGLGIMITRLTLLPITLQEEVTREWMLFDSLEYPRFQGLPNMAIGYLEP